MILDYIDPCKPGIVHETQTVLQYSVHLEFSMIVSCGFRLRSRDTAESFLQSKDPMH